MIIQFGKISYNHNEGAYIFSKKGGLLNAYTSAN